MATKSELNALFQLAQDYHYAKHGKPHDMAEAMRLYREAAQQGHLKHKRSWAIATSLVEA